MDNVGIDYRAWGFWFQVVQFAGYLILGFYVWQGNRDKATAKEIKAVRQEIKRIQSTNSDACKKHLQRTTFLEGSIKELPTHKNLGELYEKINGVKSTVDKISGSMKGLEYQLKLLIEHHMKVGK